MVRGEIGQSSIRVALAAFVLLALVALAPPPAQSQQFERIPAPIQSGRLFDLGVSDYDADGNQEVFSTNHKFLGTLIERDDELWANRMVSAGFNTNPEFPGFEDLLRVPTIDRPGLYLYAESRTESEADDEEEAPLFHIVANDIQGIPLLPEVARGTLRLPSPEVIVQSSDGADVQIRRNANRTLINFEVAEQGEIVLKVRKIDLPPIEVTIDQAPLAALTFIGADKVQTFQRNFVLRLLDRHGIAWADVRGNAATDAFIVRGGLGGGINNFPGLLDEELLVQETLTQDFENQIEQSEIVKGDCRSRQVAAADYDQDGMVDLFSACKGDQPQLYRQKERGVFESRSRPLARLGASGSFYRFVDLFGKPRPELIVTSKRRVQIFRSKGKRGWKVAQDLKALNGGFIVHGITSGDLDGDGDADVFIGSPSGNTLLKNKGRNVKVVDPTRKRLPGRGSGPAFVDFDNDGRLDLYSAPRGLYRQKGNGKFKRMRLADGRKKSIWSIPAWLDENADGYRDLAVATRTTGARPRVITKMLRNPFSDTGNHWLQLDLRGNAGNSEAIGAKVKLRSGGKTQTSWVGSSESSRYSQGHYRLYFGLGNATSVDQIKVRWPDGRRSSLSGIDADQRLTLLHPDLP